MKPHPTAEDRRFWAAKARSAEREARTWKGQPAAPWFDAAEFWSAAGEEAEVRRCWLKAAQLEEAASKTSGPQTRGICGYSAGWCYFHAGALDEAARMVSELEAEGISGIAAQRVAELREALRTGVVAQ